MLHPSRPSPMVSIYWVRPPSRDPGNADRPVPGIVRVQLMLRYSWTVRHLGTRILASLLMFEHPSHPQFPLGPCPVPSTHLVPSFQVHLLSLSDSSPILYLLAPPSATLRVCTSQSRVTAQPPRHGPNTSPMDLVQVAQRPGVCALLRIQSISASKRCTTSCGARA